MLSENNIQEKLYSAVSQGDIKTVKNLLSQESSDKLQDLKNTALADAAFLRREKIVKFLLEDLKQPAKADFNQSQALIYASQMGYTEIVNILLKHGARANDQESQALIVAARIGKEEIVNCLLKQKSNSAKADDQSSQALMHAVKHNNITMIRSLLEQDQNPAKANDRNSHALAIGAQFGSIDAILFLLEQEENLLEITENAIVFAIQFHQTRAFKVLFEHPRNSIPANIEGGELLSMASAQNLTEIMKILLEQEINPAKANSFDGKILSTAAWFGYEDQIHLLLSQNTNPISKDVKSQALKVAAANKHVAATHCLIDHHVINRYPIPADNNVARIQKERGECNVVAATAAYGFMVHRKNASNTQARAFSDLVIEKIIQFLAGGSHGTNRDILLVKRLLKAHSISNNKNLRDLVLYEFPSGNVLPNAEINPIKKEEEQALDFLRAAQYGQLYSVKQLLEKCENPKEIINYENEKGSTALLLAASNGHADVLKVLLEYHPRMNNRKGITALYISAQNGHKELVLMLLQYFLNHKADPEQMVNESVSTGFTALGIAAYEGHEELLKESLQYIFNNYLDPKQILNQCDKENRTTLTIAAYRKHKSIVELLLKYNPNIQNSGTNTLHFAAQNDEPEIMELLLSYISTTKLPLNHLVNQVTENGFTPLFMAAAKGHSKVVSLLLKYGAEIEYVNLTGESPLWAACCYNRKEVVEILLESLFKTSKSPEKIIFQCNEEESSPISVSAQKRHSEIVNLLIKFLSNYKKTKQSNKNNYIALLEASKKGKCNLIEKLFKKTYENNDPKTLIYVASQNKRIEVVRLLLMCFIKYLSNPAKKINDIVNNIIDPCMDVTNLLQEAIREGNKTPRNPAILNLYISEEQRQGIVKAVQTQPYGPYADKCRTQIRKNHF